MEHGIPLPAGARADDPSRDKERDDSTHEVLPDVAYKRLILVNVAFVGAVGAGDDGWVLIDAGLPGTAGAIREAANERFGGGRNTRPAAILLTHGHFDHVSALRELAELWGVPIFAHPFEMPYLTGQAAYPPPDPSVGNGLMSALSPLFPRTPIDVGQWLHPFPTDNSVPFLPGWRWIHTPGHTPGHVSFWRESDRTLITGDAFITTVQESAYAVAVQKPELHGPPMYYTQDWEAARISVERLAMLEPEIAVTGHGRAMRGQDLRTALHTLAENFDRIAVPEQGRYVVRPAQVGTNAAYDTHAT
ncbi:MAG: MBL fold metallo-hydrolase [Capsulimonadales bacterium]|nr:MBL fold metallo-hydrolase [Capsulimonadales bacterium]